MVNEIRINGDNIEFQDVALGDSRTLSELSKGDHSAHKTRHENGGADKINIAGLSGEPADTVNKTGAQTIAGVKTLSDNLVFSGDKIIQTNVKASAYLSTNQLNLVSSAWTKVLLDSESYDVGSDFANYKFTVPVTGYYLITGAVYFTEVIVSKIYYVALYKNNASIATQPIHSVLNTALGIQITKISYLAADDYIELFARQDSGANTVDIYGVVSCTFMDIHLISV